MSGALEGLLVVSVEQAVAAPFCSARLREAGARVIKVERPGGDFARAYDGIAGGDSSYFFWLNQGKESLELDFKNPPASRASSAPDHLRNFWLRQRPGGPGPEGL